MVVTKYRRVLQLPTLASEMLCFRIWFVISNCCLRQIHQSFPVLLTTTYKKDVQLRFSICMKIRIAYLYVAFIHLINDWKGWKMRPIKWINVWKSLSLIILSILKCTPRIIFVLCYWIYHIVIIDQLLIIIHHSTYAYFPLKIKLRMILLKKNAIKLLFTSYLLKSLIIIWFHLIHFTN